MAAAYATSTSAVSVLKELYVDDQSFMKDLVYAKNPSFALIPKDESTDGLAGKYIPCPIQFGDPQGRSHTFSNAQGNQTPNQYDSFFVYIIQDYQLVTITNLLIEQTRSNAGSFVDEMKREMDGGIKNLSNNMAFEQFGSGTATRGFATAAPVSLGGGVYQLTLTNPQQIVNFEVGMTIQESATDGGAPIPTGTPTTPDLGSITAVDRSTGTINFTVAQGAPQTDWVANGAITVQGDIPTGGGSGFGPIGQTGSYLAASGYGAWIPLTDPGLTDSFWGVNRSADPTRLGGLRFNASAYTIEEGVVNGLAFANREGADPDVMVLNFNSYSALENALGAKVQYVDIKHQEADVAFEGIRFHSAYGYLTVYADRNQLPQQALCLTMDTFKLRSLDKAPHILTYGLEGLEGLRVGNSDALEVRVGAYYNYTCNAPGWNLRIQLSA
jgi:hypothetical protein